VLDFLQAVTSLSPDANVDGAALDLVVCFARLLCDLLSQLASRRFVLPLLGDLHVLPLMQLHASRHRPQLVAALHSWVAFPVNHHTGTALTEAEAEERHHATLVSLQACAFAFEVDDNKDADADVAAAKPLRDLAFCATGRLRAWPAVEEHMRLLSDAQLARFCSSLGVVSPPELQHIDLGVSLPTTDAANQQFLSVLDERGDEDFSAVYAAAAAKK